MNAVPGFFASLFGELLLDNDCDNIENDPKADPTEKELCRSFRQFSNSFHHLEPHMDQEEGSGRSAEDTDPQALRDSILSRPEHPGYEEHVPPSRQRHSPADRDLDTQVEADPSLLEEFLGRGKGPPPTKRPHPHFHSSYSSVVITRRPDGSYEERRTVRDSDGNEEVTVTRSDGSSEVHEGGAGEDRGEHKSSSRFDSLSDWFWPKRS